MTAPAAMTFWAVSWRVGTEQFVLDGLAQTDALLLAMLIEEHSPLGAEEDIRVTEYDYEPTEDERERLARLRERLLARARAESVAAAIREAAG